MAQYKLVGVDIGGVRRFIVCDASQNPCPRDRCSCPLIAIANLLILTGAGEVDKCVAGEDVTAKKITNMIARTLAKRMEQAKKNRSTSDEVADICTLALTLYRRLWSISTDGLHMDPIFESPSRFKLTDEYRLLLYSGIQLLHSGVIGPAQSDFYNAYHTMSHDHMASMLGGLDGSFEEMMDKLRKTGLAFLPLHVDEGGLAVFYRDDHFSVIHKYKGAIFTLETDHNILTSLPGATWKALDVKDMFYLTSQYNPTPKQPNFNQAQEWCDAKLAETLRELGETVDNVTRNEQIKQNRTSRELKKSKEKGEADDEAESSNESNPIPTLPVGNEDEGDDGLRTISSNFFEFLRD